jgi:hypothetical protein
MRKMWPTDIAGAPVTAQRRHFPKDYHRVRRSGCGGLLRRLVRSLPHDGTRRRRTRRTRAGPSDRGEAKHRSFLSHRRRLRDPRHSDNYSIRSREGGRAPIRRAPTRRSKATSGESGRGGLGAWAGHCDQRFLATRNVVCFARRLRCARLATRNVARTRADEAESGRIAPSGA